MSTGLDETTIMDFIGRLRGPAILPGSDDYDEARSVRNGMIDRRPEIIVRCSGVADVVEAVNFARDNGLLLSVRGGAHNVAGNAVNDGGVVIDLSGMKAAHVDPVSRTARAQGGATWGDIDRETQLFGLAAPGGVVSTTGIGGLTLHGGLGHLRRKHGLSLDNLVSVDIVTADGQVRHASESENSDLFWAVRGAGSNFGVIVSFEFRLHPVGPMVALCAPMFAAGDRSGIVRAWRDFVDGAPDEVNSIFLFWNVPDNEHFPEEARRQPVGIAAAVYAGPLEEGERVLQPLREIATPLLDLSGPITYTALQGAFDPFFPKGRRYYWKSIYVDTLTDDAVDTYAQCAEKRPSILSSATLWHLGGAIGRVDPTATAYYRRDAPYLFAAEASWDDPAADDANIAWARDSLAAMQPYSRGGAYLNFPGFGEEKETMLRAAYGPNYDRLAAIKHKYDPGNLFRMNLNIKPVAG